MNRRTAALLAGAWLDAGLGDPPNRWHPVAALGRVIGALEGRSPADPRGRRGYGAAAAAGLPLATGALALLAVRTAGRAPGGALVASAALLALATSQRTLVRRALEVADALERDNVDTARLLVATHLVSRDVSTLDSAGVAAATIESVAENLSDGVIAPWCWFAVGGAPGAWGYRAANTLDAMWGYRDAPYEELGMAAARLDDALNLVPARLTAAALLAASGGAGAATWWRDRALTESPNAGHPMSAMAGALGVRLAKQGDYVLGAAGRAPTATDIRRAVALARRATWIALSLLAVAMWWRGRR